jgi:capsular polysaccharide biosynthesis protein
MNITSIIEKATTLDINWKHFDFQNIVDVLSKNYCVNIEIVEERIAIIAIKNVIIGYLCLNYPLFFIEDKYYSEIKLLLNQFNYLQYINVNNLFEESLSVDAETYNKYFNFMENLENFSAEDFYFYNIN